VDVQRYLLIDNILRIIAVNEQFSIFLLVFFKGNGNQFQ